MRKNWYTQRGVYVAANPTYRVDESDSRVHQLAATGRVHVFGYRAANMSAGFGKNEIVGLVSDICRIAWVYDGEKGILRHASAFGDLAWGMAISRRNGRVVIYEPDATLLKENERLAEYRKAIKFHEIKLRRSVPSVEPEAPLLVKLGIGTNATPLLDYAIEHSAFILEWLYSECFDHFRSIDGTANAKSFLLAKFAEANLPVFEIDDPDDLPYD